MEHRNYKIIYRRYASLFFLVGVDGEEVTSFILHPYIAMLSGGCVLCDDNLVCASKFFFVMCVSFDHYCT